MSESYRAWAASMLESGRQAITEAELLELWQWTAKHGSGNGWTGQSGRIAALIRYLMADRERLRRLLSDQPASVASTTVRSDADKDERRLPA